MRIFQSYLTGLLAVHLAWFYFFTTGQLLRRTSPAEVRSISLADLVITSVAGMALSGFALLFLGFAHLLNGFGLASGILVEGALFWLLKSDNCMSAGFWKLTVQAFFKAWTMPACFIYVLFLALGVPAVLPPTTSDSVSYHLAYAVDWANAGRIYVDQFLRFPYYANNFLLLHSAFFILRLGVYCHFLTWLCGLLTGLGVLAFFAPGNTEARWPDPKQWWVQAPQFLIPLAVVLAPVFLRYLNVGMLDVPIGLFVLVPILCTYRTFSGHAFQGELVVTAAFCVAMKLTLIGLLPLFVFSLFIACRGGLRRRNIALLSAGLIVLSLPWYARNLGTAHDPTPPIFNFLFDRPDPVFTRADAELYTSDTITERTPTHLLLLPVQFFADPTSKNFREPGITAMILLLYAPALFLGAQPFLPSRWRWPYRLNYLSAAVIYLAFPWLFSSLGRYSVHWYPVLGAWVGVVLAHVCKRTEALWNSHLGIWTVRVATSAFCLALIIPSPARGLSFYRDYYAAVSNLWRLGGNSDRYLERNIHGYLAGKAVIETLASAKNRRTRVLVLGTESLNFYFRRNGNIVSVGDYFGPARYRDLFDELNHSKDCLSYLTRLDISVVITPPFRPDPRWPLFYQEFRERLRRCGYNEYRCAEENMAIYLRSDIKPSSKLHPVL